MKNELRAHRLTAWSCVAMVVFFLLPFLSASGQILGIGGTKLDDFKASNGITYHIGDTIKLAQGSGTDGTFQSIQYGGWTKALSMGSGANSHNLERNASGYGAVIKKIRSFDAGNGAKKILFTVGLKGANNFDLWIEDAIAHCEIVNCKTTANALTAVPQPTDKLDQIKKLKALLDDGAITASEYDTQKKKILNQ